MSLVTCSDCRQPVSLQAFACPGCGRPMRDRSYLTPMAQAAVGALVLVACFARPPLISILIFIVFGRYLARARRGSTRGLLVAAGAVIALSAACVYLLHSLALALAGLILGTATLMWLASSRFGASKAATAQDIIA